MITVWIVVQTRRILDGPAKGKREIKKLRFLEKDYAEFFNKTYTVKHRLDGPPFEVEKVEIIERQVPENYDYSSIYLEGS